MSTIQSIRPSVLAGMWYPADARQLTETITTYMDAAHIERHDPVMGLLTPHAGLRYSGPIAAYAFKQLEGFKPETVVILSPFHRPPANLFDAIIVTSQHLAYSTPLGDVPVDQDAINALSEKLPINAIGGDQEHAIEIVLPMLQHVLGNDFSIVPMMLVSQSKTMLKRIGQVLAQTFAPETTLLIASSDLSHFFSQDSAHRLDQLVLDAIRDYNPEGVLKEGSKPGGKGACGYGAIAAVMWACALWGANKAQILHYATSGDTGGDMTQVVGYAAGAFTKDNQV